MFRDDNNIFSLYNIKKYKSVIQVNIYLDKKNYELYNWVIA